MLSSANETPSRGDSFAPSLVKRWELMVEAVSALAVQGVPVELSVFGSAGLGQPATIGPEFLGEYAGGSL